MISPATTSTTKLGRKAQRRLARIEMARQRLDLALIPNMLFGVAKLAQVDDVVLEAIRLACLEPLGGLDRHQQVCNAKRITEVCHRFMDEFSGHALPKVMVMIFRLLEMVSQQGIINIPAEHPCTLAVEAMAEELADPEEHPDAWNEAIEDSASKQARKLLSRLQAEGILLPPQEV